MTRMWKEKIMKTIRICYEVHPFYCPKCKALYYLEVDCKCDNGEQNE